MPDPYGINSVLAGLNKDSNPRALSLLWGYSSSYKDGSKDTNASAGLNYLSLTAVPDGEIWIVTHIVAYNDNSICSVLQLQMRSGDSTYLIRRVVNVAADEEILWTGNIIMEAGEYIRGLYAGCNAGDDIYLYALGYKMQV
jgi:hypothetical protein